MTREMVRLLPLEWFVLTSLYVVLFLWMAIVKSKLLMHGSFHFFVKIMTIDWPVITFGPLVTIFVPLVQLRHGRRTERDTPVLKAFCYIMMLWLLLAFGVERRS